ncbi:MAG: class I SAM-dependent methyltransferase [Sphingobacteriales bacterium]|nr:class I SAM-dependent methyltransferase [Sphingobacteriales bacterium]
MAKDLFSAQANEYAKFRPVYPPALIEYIVSFCKEKEAAWDCATGNGQAAVLLAEHFKKVYATDISKTQIKNAAAKDNIDYSISPAENTLFADNSFDLITVAQAYHWINWDHFRHEVMRVAKPGAVIAVWMYNLLSTDDKAVDELLLDFYKNIVGPYWDAERKYVDDNYTTVAFDYELLPTQSFEIKADWTRDHFLGYLTSWSATKNFEKEQHYPPVDKIETPLKALWKSGEVKHISFPIVLKLGRVVK